MEQLQPQRTSHTLSHCGWAGSDPTRHNNWTLLAHALALPASLFLQAASSINNSVYFYGFYAHKDALRYLYDYFLGKLKEHII